MGVPYFAADRSVQFTNELLKEVIPAVEKTYRVKTGRENRALAGLSMGRCKLPPRQIGPIRLIRPIPKGARTQSTDTQPQVGKAIGKERSTTGTASFTCAAPGESVFRAGGVLLPATGSSARSVTMV